jgi:aminopeptidase N
LRALRLSLAIVCTASLVLAAPAPAAPEPGGEPFFPQAGDPGIDVVHYGVALRFDAGTGAIQANEAILMNSTRRLRRIGLDLRGLRVTSVDVGGERAPFSRGQGKLWIRPRREIPAGESFSVTVDYRGQPAAITDPDGTKEGWLRTGDGALALGEPQGTAAWLACDNVPADKATFDVHIDVPRPLVAVSNGRLTEVARRGSRRRYSWQGQEQMSTYLALVDIGRGHLVKSEIAGRPSWTLIDPRLEKGSRRVLAALPAIVRFESKLYGSYPFAAAGSVVDYAPQIGYALETQSRPFYPYVPDLTTVVHETAHQWFGDSVGLRRWPEIWLNEGFATWTEWYYAERHGRRSARQIFNRLYRVPASNVEFWNPPSAHPGTAKNLFGPSIYIRGAMALEALRLKIGTRPMLRLLRSWAGEHRYGSGTIKEFTALAENISGRNLDPLFQRWLYRRGKP